MARVDIDDAAAAASATFNMTPMIDVVFQLIIFLMLANDMSRKEIEDLELPEAVHASEDKREKEKYRIIVNLLKSDVPGAPPTLKVKGQEMTIAEFQQFIKPDADRKSRWQDVQWVMQSLADPGLKVYKLQFATHNPQPDNAPASGN